MAATQALADVEQQQSKHEPEYRGRRGRTWGTPINLKHAKVAREKKPPALAPVDAPAPPIAKPRSPVGGFITNYSDLVDVCRERATELKLSRLETDRLAGLPDGHAGHLLSKSFSKFFGPVSLLPVLQTLGLRLLLVEDPEWTAHTLQRRTPCQASHIRQPRELPAPSGDSSAA